MQADGKLVLSADSENATAFLYQGSVGAAHNQESIKAAGITHILTAASAIKQNFPELVKYHQLPLLDTPSQSVQEHFESAWKFINECREAKGRILVHCFAGKSRASTVTLSYIMSEMKVNLKDAYDHLKKCRPIAQPNAGFMQQLKTLEFGLFGSNSDVPIVVASSEEESEPEATKSEEEKSLAKEINDGMEAAGTGEK